MPFYECAENSPNYHPNIICSGPSCNRGITQKQSVVSCGMCLKMYHPSCKGIIGATKIKKATESNWGCSPICVRPTTSNPETADSQVTATSQPVGYEAAISNLLSQMNSQFADLKLLITEIRASQEFICNEFDEICKKTKIIAEENADLYNKYENLNKSYHKYNERLNLVEAQLDIPLQKEIANNIVICGVPQEVPDIGNYIMDKFRIVNSDAHITGIKKMNHHPKSKTALRDAFVLTLNSLEMKNDVLSKIKAHHRTSRSSSTSSSPSPSQICFRVMNHLTKFQSKLYQEAKKLQLTHKYKYLWTKDSKIFLRKQSDSMIHHIFCMNDIFRLANCSTADQNPENQNTIDQASR